MKNLTKTSLSLALMIMINGCALNDLSLPSSEPTINDTLPVVTSFNTISEMTQIAFEWERAEDPSVVGYQIFRAKNGGELKKVATIKDRFSTHYVDTGLEPDSSYDYAMATYDKSGAISALGTKYTLKTEPGIAAVEFVQVISNMPNRAKIIWSPHDDTRVTGYDIERSPSGKNEWKKIDHVKGRLSAEYIDTGLKPSNSFDYRVRAKTNDGVLSAPSQTGNALTKALPREVMNIRATTDQPKKIVISWDALEVPDFKHYKIYSARATFLPPMEVATTTDTRYEDFINSNDSTRYYKVTAIDKDGLESPKGEWVEGATLKAPDAPQIVMASFVGNGIDIAWNSNYSTFYLYKDGGGVSKKFKVTGTRYLDSDITPGVKYKYNVSALDNYGLESKQSDTAVVETK